MHAHVKLAKRGWTPNQSRTSILASRHEQHSQVGTAMQRSSRRFQVESSYLRRSGLQIGSDQAVPATLAPTLPTPLRLCLAATPRAGLSRGSSHYGQRRQPSQHLAEQLAVKMPLCQQQPGKWEMGTGKWGQPQLRLIDRVHDCRKSGCLNHLPPVSALDPLPAAQWPGRCNPFPINNLKAQSAHRPSDPRLAQFFSPQVSTASYIHSRSRHQETKQQTRSLLVLDPHPTVRSAFRV